VTLTLLDEFSGWGGSSSGATAVLGIELLMALNHNKLSIEVHSKNFPRADHYCGDVAKADITRLPRADLYWGSPACPKWSNARGVARDFDNSLQGVMFDDELGVVSEPEVVRSRALMEEVPRYLRAMALKGKPVLAGVVENVVECRRWDEWPRWIGEIRAEGYETKVIAFNSMHAAGVNTRRAPQSRDRLYVAFWLKSLRRTPDWNKWLRPKAYCPTCDEQVYAMQVFKNLRNDMGRYGQTNGQYMYRCPRSSCRFEVIEPHVVPAVEVIDFSIPMGKPIGERTAKSGKDRAIVDATKAKVEIGLERIRRSGVMRPFIAELRGGGSTVRGINKPLATFSAQGYHHALVTPPGTEGIDWRHLLLPYYRNGVPHPVTEPLRTLTTRSRYALIEVPDSLRVDDCRIRMLTPPEIGAGMAFPLGYKTAGKPVDHVRGYGNAVTPPVAELLMSALYEAISGEQLALAA
jgi:DNA (cytosine-5)-methyltransferase 1